MDFNSFLRKFLLRTNNPPLGETKLFLINYESAIPQKILEIVYHFYNVLYRFVKSNKLKIDYNHEFYKDGDVTKTKIYSQYASLTQTYKLTFLRLILLITSCWLFLKLWLE